MRDEVQLLLQIDISELCILKLVLFLIFKFFMFHDIFKFVTRTKRSIFRTSEMTLFMSYLKLVGHENLKGH